MAQLGSSAASDIGAIDEKQITKLVDVYRGTALALDGLEVAYTEFSTVPC